MELFSQIRDLHSRPMANGQWPTAFTAAIILAFSLSAHAQFYNPPPGSGQPAGQKPAILNSVGLDQKLNNPLPLGAQFRDERGDFRRVTSSSLSKGPRTRTYA